MCGITGIRSSIGAKSVTEEMLSAMTRRLSHRGPDGEGIYVHQDRTLGLGHRRLSIIDLSTGSQPMSNPGKTLWIVFNGEIYNYRELREDLKKAGFQFQTSSDTEVILALYEKYGEKAFAKLNGIFAFAIYDIMNDELILVRDPFGVKPLYYAEFNGVVIFSSEIKAILACPYASKEFNEAEYSNFLLFRFNPSPGTLFKQISKLNPGSYAKINRRCEIRLTRFAPPVAPIDHSISVQEAVELYCNRLHAAVKRQMIADVPVGLLLSGGLDSAMVGYLMQNGRTDRVKTFTIGFEGTGDFNEIRQAEETARFLGTDHNSLIISEKDYREIFFNSFVSLEEPIAITSTVALYFITQLASKELKVVLSGQGADEPLAGYPRYVAQKLLYKQRRVIRSGLALFPDTMLSRHEQLRRLRLAAAESGGAQRLLALYSIFTPDQQKMLRRNSDGNARQKALTIVNNLYELSAPLNDELNRMLYVDTRLSLSDCLLLLADKVSMVNSLELRVPYLDIELVAFLESLPSAYKLRGRVGKYLHKEAAKRWLPPHIINRKKLGFATPMGQWLRKEMAEFTKSLVNDRASATYSLLDIGRVNELIEKHQSGRWNYEREIFLLLSFEMWYQSFFTTA